MTHETPQQRRIRLIEQYVPQLLKLCQGEVMPPADQLINWATRLAEAVIAATPQAGPTCYPSEAETRLIELCETAIASLQARGASNTSEMLIGKLAAIKRDLGLT